MQSHISQLTKQRLSDFFVKEDGHVAHKNAFVAGTVASGAILASLLLDPHTAEAHVEQRNCGDIKCNHDEYCCSRPHENDLGEWVYFCEDDGCPRVAR